MQIMDGKEVAASLRKQIASEVEALVAAGNRPPHLAAVLVGNDGASQTYVGHKEKCCGEVGFRSTVLRLPEETTEEALLARDRPAERRSGRRRLHRAASVAEAHLGAEGDRGDRSAQGRGRVSSGQYGADDFGPARPICPLRPTGFWSCSSTTRSKPPESTAS